MSVSITRNPRYQSHKEHIVVQYPFIRGKLDMGLKELKYYYPSKHMVADMVNKTLTRDKHKRPWMAYRLKDFDYTQIWSVQVELYERATNGFQYNNLGDIKWHGLDEDRKCRS